MKLLYIRLLLFLAEQLKKVNVFLIHVSSFFYKLTNTIKDHGWKLLNNLPCQSCGSTGSQSRARECRKPYTFLCTACMKPTSLEIRQRGAPKTSILTRKSNE